MDRKNTVWLFPLICIITLFVSACSHDPTRSELIGSYEAKYKYGTESLVLKGDGTYQQTFRYNDGHILANSGKWEYPQRTSMFEDRLILRGALIVDNDHGEPEKNVRKMNWHLGAEKDSNKNIKLPFNTDLDYAYHKKESGN